MRSVVACERYLLRMAGGDYMKHICGFVDLLADQGALSRCGFLLPANSSKASARAVGLSETTDLCEHLVEDEFAQLWGQGILSMISARLVRGLWMFGWPRRMFLVLLGGEVAETTITLFQQDDALFKELRQDSGLVAAGRAVLKRHVGNMVANRQLSAALDELGIGAATRPDFIGLLHSRYRAIQATQIVEEMHGCMSKAAMQPCRKYRTPATCMAAVLASNLVPERHGYDNADSFAPPPCRRPVLPRVAFEPVAKNASLPFGDIVSVSQTPSCFSTSAERMTMPVADLSLIREVKQSGSWNNLSLAWLGSAFDAKHQVALGFRDAPGSERIAWFLPIHYFPASSVLMWPVQEVQCGNHKFLQLEQGLTEPVLRPILGLDPSRVVLWRYQWRSWLWQVGSLRGASDSLRPEVRCVLEGQQGSFLEIACRSCWW